MEVQPACNAINGVAAVPIPAGEIKSTCLRLVFTIETFQERHYFVPEHQEPIGILAQQLAERRGGRVIGQMAAHDRFHRCLNG